MRFYFNMIIAIFILIKSAAENKAEATIVTLYNKNYKECLLCKSEFNPAPHFLILNEELLKKLQDKLKNIKKTNQENYQPPKLTQNIFFQKINLSDACINQKRTKIIYQTFEMIENKKQSNEYLEPYQSVASQYHKSNFEMHLFNSKLVPNSLKLLFGQLFHQTCGYKLLSHLNFNFGEYENKLKSQITSKKISEIIFVCPNDDALKANIVSLLLEMPNEEIARAFKPLSSLTLELRSKIFNIPSLKDYIGFNSNIKSILKINIKFYTIKFIFEKYIPEFLVYIENYSLVNQFIDFSQKFIEQIIGNSISDALNEFIKGIHQLSNQNASYLENQTLNNKHEIVKHSFVLFDMSCYDKAPFFDALPHFIYLLDLFLSISLNNFKIKEADNFIKKSQYLRIGLLISILLQDQIKIADKKFIQKYIESFFNFWNYKINEYFCNKILEEGAMFFEEIIFLIDFKKKKEINYPRLILDILFARNKNYPWESIKTFEIIEFLIRECGILNILDECNGRSKCILEGIRIERFFLCFPSTDDQIVQLLDSYGKDEKKKIFEYIEYIYLKTKLKEQNQYYATRLYLFKIYEGRDLHESKMLYYLHYISLRGTKGLWTINFISHIKNIGSLFNLNGRKKICIVKKIKKYWDYFKVPPQGFYKIYPFKIKYIFDSFSELEIKIWIEIFSSDENSVKIFQLKYFLKNIIYLMNNPPSKSGISAIEFLRICKEPLKEKLKKELLEYFKKPNENLKEKNSLIIGFYSLLNNEAVPNIEPIIIEQFDSSSSALSKKTKRKNEGNSGSSSNRKKRKNSQFSESFFYEETKSLSNSCLQASSSEPDTIPSSNSELNTIPTSNSEPITFFVADPSKSQDCAIAADDSHKIIQIDKNPDNLLEMLALNLEKKNNRTYDDCNILTNWQDIFDRISHQHFDELFQETDYSECPSQVSRQHIDVFIQETDYSECPSQASHQHIDVLVQETDYSENLDILNSYGISEVFEISETSIYSEVCDLIGYSEDILFESNEWNFLLDGAIE